MDFIPHNKLAGKLILGHLTKPVEKWL